MPSRKVMNGNGDDRLTPQQQTGVDPLVSGKTLTDAAVALGVTRETVSGWVNHHPPFLAALNARRQEASDGMVDTLRGLLPRGPCGVAGGRVARTPYRPRSRC